jgi:hypothetical protein
VTILGCICAAYPVFKVFKEQISSNFTPVRRLHTLSFFKINLRVDAVDMREDEVVG